MTACTEMCEDFHLEKVLTIVGAEWLSKKHPCPTFARAFYCQKPTCMNLCFIGPISLHPLTIFHTHNCPVFLNAALFLISKYSLSGIHRGAVCKLIIIFKGVGREVKGRTTQVCCTTRLITAFPHWAYRIHDTRWVIVIQSVTAQQTHPGKKAECRDTAERDNK